MCHPKTAGKQQEVGKYPHRPAHGQDSGLHYLSVLSIFRKEWLFSIMENLYMNKKPVRC